MAKICSGRTNIILLYDVNMLFGSALLPFKVAFYNRFVSFARIAVIADFVVSGCRIDAKAFRSDNSLVGKLHVLCALDERAK